LHFSKLLVVGYEKIIPNENQPFSLHTRILCYYRDGDMVAIITKSFT